VRCVRACALYDLATRSKPANIIAAAAATVAITDAVAAGDAR